MAEDTKSSTVPWLRELEEKVQETGKRISGLREQNGQLQEQVDELEIRLADAPAPEEKAAWQGERDEIRQRVESLVEHLSGMLAETETEKKS